jgi:hypothetical protein
MNKYPEAVSIVQQVCKVLMLSDIEDLAGCTRTKVGESSECTSAVNSAEENRANFCKALVGNSHFSVPYGMYMVTLNELKAVLKVGAQEGQSDAVNKTPVDSTMQSFNILKQVIHIEPLGFKQLITFIEETFHH